MTLKNIFTKKLYIIIFAIICTFLWGSAFPCVKKGYELFHISNEDIPSYILFAGIRFFFAGILTLIISRLFHLDSNLDSTTSIKQMYFNRNFVINAIVLSFFITFFQYICFYVGLSYASATNASLINASSTIFTVILSFIFFRTEKITITKLIGIIFSFCGIIIVTFRDTSSIDSSGLLSLNLKGEGLLLIAALSFAIGTIYSKKYASTYNPATLTGAQLSIGGLTLIVTGLVLGGRLNFTSTTAIMLLLYLSLLSAIAFTIWTILLKYNQASKIAIFNSLTPVFGVILSGLIAHEHIWDIHVILALVFACGGIICMNYSRDRDKM